MNYERRTAQRQPVSRGLLCGNWSFFCWLKQKIDLILNRNKDNKYTTCSLSSYSFSLLFWITCQALDSILVNVTLMENWRNGEYFICTLKYAYKQRSLIDIKWAKTLNAAAHWTNSSITAMNKKQISSSSCLFVAQQEKQSQSTLYQNTGRVFVLPSTQDDIFEEVESRLRWAAHNTH